MWTSCYTCCDDDGRCNFCCTAIVSDHVLCAWFSVPTMCTCVCVCVYIVPAADIQLPSMVTIYRGPLRTSLLDFERPYIFKARCYLLFFHYLLCIYFLFIIGFVVPEQRERERQKRWKFVASTLLSVEFIRKELVTLLHELAARSGLRRDVVAWIEVCIKESYNLCPDVT